MMKQNQDLFEKMPVPQAVLKNSLPAIMAMLVVLIYNIADTFFVGQTGDALQVAAVSIATPVFLLFMAMGTLFGIGGTSVISRALGEKKADYAKHVSSFCFFCSIAFGILLMIVFWVAMDWILHLIGTSADTITHTRSYLNWIALSAPFVIFSTAFSSIVRAEGRAKEAMMGMMLGTVINIVLDPIFILTFDMGVTGAAIATVIGNVCASIYYLSYFAKKDSILSIKKEDLRINTAIAVAVFSIGTPAAFNSILMSVSGIIMNNFLASYGDIPLAAMGVAMKVSMIGGMLLIGLGQGVQPLLGYCYGAKNVDRFKEIMRFGLLFGICLGGATTALCWFGSTSIVKAFISDAQVVTYGVQFVKMIMISSPVLAILFLFTNALQAIGAVGPSFVLSLSRQGLVYIPLLFILNYYFQLDGLIYAQPVADYLSIAISGGLYYKEVAKMESHSALTLESA